MNKHKTRLRRGKKTRYRILLSNKPRLVVFRSGKHMYAQIIVPEVNGSKVVVSCSTLDKEVRQHMEGTKIQQAALVGERLAERALKNDVSEVAFDRSGYHYHGRVSALAEGARKGGLKF